MATTKKTTKKAAPKAKKVEPKHITPELICAVIRGEYGTPEERGVNLKAAGYSASAVTKKINDLKKLMPEYVAVCVKAGEYFPALLELIATE